jgi:perosamine synthetase
MAGHAKVNGEIPTLPPALPYGRQWVDEDDIAAVVEVLRSDWLTTGPKVLEFERAFAVRTGAKEAVALSNGTAALHAVVHALGISPGDEVIVTPMTFAASANCVVYQGGTPVFADVDTDTLLLDPAQVEAKVTPRTKAIIAMDYAGQPCDYDALRQVAQRHSLHLVADACHSVGGAYRGFPVGSVADLSVFSFHPVKQITSGEGGAVTTNDPDLASRMRTFRNHGITSDHKQREEEGSWFYEMVDLGYNYRLTDIQCALVLSQLGKLSAWIYRRQAIARRYDEAFAQLVGVSPLEVLPEVSHAYHLYVIRLDERYPRAAVFRALRAEGIGVNVHYIPVYRHPFYQKRFGTGPGLCPVAESAYEHILSLPMFPRMTNDDVDRVIATLIRVLKAQS